MTPVAAHPFAQRSSKRLKRPTPDPRHGIGRYVGSIESAQWGLHRSPSREGSGRRDRVASLAISDGRQLAAPLEKKRRDFARRDWRYLRQFRPARPQQIESKQQDYEQDGDADDLPDVAPAWTRVDKWPLL